MFVLSPTAEPDRPRPDDPVRLRRLRHPAARPATRRPSSRGSRPAACTPSPNLRGGGEEGEEWHRAGMLGNKQNVFDDFHAAAEWLIAQGWTTRRPARHLRRQQRRPARRRRHDAAPRPVRRRRLRRPAARHDPLHDLRARGRRGRSSTATPRYAEQFALAARLLAVPPRHRGHGLPGDDVHGLRQRHAHGPDARTQDVRRRCSTRRRARARSCCAPRATSGTGPARCRSRSTRRPTRSRSSPTGRGSS